MQRGIPVEGYAIDPQLVELAARIGIDIVAMTVLIFFMYYRRYRDKSLATTASMFNIFAFAVLTVLSSVEFSIAAGFGLFAILALFSLRSEQIEKTEISYFFGSVAIAVICSVLGTSLIFVLVITCFILVAAWFLDHPKILQTANAVKLTLDKIDAHALSDVPLMRAQLSERLGVEVMTFRIVELNYVNDLARLNVYYRAQE
jgi:hypothetical protein